jgi:hypothetical protein
MIETKFTDGQPDAKLTDLEAQVRQIEKEKLGFKMYLRELQNQHDREVSVLRSKLQSAFEVTSEFRREITKLTNSPLPDDGSPEYRRSPTW